MSSFPVSRPVYDPGDSRPLRDAKYLAWIRTLPCAVPNCGRRSEAAHTGGHGLAQRASDRRAIPLCAGHHREYRQLGRRRFEQTHSLDIEVLIERLNRKPLVRILGGRYVALVDQNEHDLGSVRKPVAAAVKQAILIARSRLAY